MQYYLNIFENLIMEIIVSELRLATLIISSCLGGFLLTECICRQDMNIPRSLFFGDSGIFMPTTTVYAWPDINIGALECDIAPFIFWKNIIISFVIMRTKMLLMLKCMIYIHLEFHFQITYLMEQWHWWSHIFLVFQSMVQIQDVAVPSE